MEELKYINFLSIFETQVQRSFFEKAVCTETTSLSYKELDLQSNKLVVHLENLGVKKGDIVGLSSFSDEYFIIALIGILKIGGVYLPLDPIYPSSMLDYIVKDASPKIILTQDKFRHFFSKFTVPIINLKKILTEAVYGIRLNVKIFPEDPAYIVYTSGSTGDPKGIVVAHRSLQHIGIAHRSFYPKKTRALISGGICFDATILAIFHSLLNGGCLYLTNFGANSDIDNLCKFIENHPINYMICVPSLYCKILKGSSSLSKLRCVSLTGEMIPYSLCISHREKCPNAFLYNEYGPSEYAIGTSIKKIYDPVQNIFFKVTIGKPLLNTKVYILNKDLSFCEVEKKGEIYIEGIGLATGYLNNNKLTLKSFIELSLDNGRKIKVYKTGDVGRYTKNGELEFLGRMSHYVILKNKIVFIGEIEAKIYEHPEITGVFVLKEKGELVAYITTITFPSKDINLQVFLSKSLKSFMIPKKIVYVNDFPLSPNGKIDKKALFLNKT